MANGEYTGDRVLASYVLMVLFRAISEINESRRCFSEGFLVDSFKSLTGVFHMSNVKLNAAKSVIGLIPEKGSIGLGSGSTVAIFAKELGRRVESGEVDVSVVPSSYQAYQLAIDFNIPLTNLDINPELLLTIDGADEVDKELNLTKGGGGALFQEKVVASASKKLIIIVDESKLVEKLATRFLIPVEVLPFSLGVVKKTIKKMGIDPILRQAQKKMGPVVTDNGNFIVDLKFPKPIDNPAQVAIDLKMIPGVMETGLFIGMTDEVHIGTAEGAYILKK
ncbi:ribose 5-phosphate isomerase A [Candidatus Thorarchaeota archaeon]|nr:MAG: ribose 5-phosphate isomerase A [Candidatus Thorarchaeota archaeon]